EDIYILKEHLLGRQAGSFRTLNIPAGGRIASAAQRREKDLRRSRAIWIARLERRGADCDKGLWLNSQSLLFSLSSAKPSPSAGWPCCKRLRARGKPRLCRLI